MLSQAIIFRLQGAAALVLWYGGYLAFHEKIQPGTLISLMLYTLNLAMCFAFLSNVYGELMQVYYFQCVYTRALFYCYIFIQAVGASVRVFELLDRCNEIRDGEEILETLKGGIHYTHLV